MGRMLVVQKGSASVKREGCGAQFPRFLEKMLDVSMAGSRRWPD